MNEVAFIIVGEKVIRIDAGSPTAIPDNAERWDTIWEHRHAITEIAHTHPGGLLRFSTEDLGTMEAVESATGRTFVWTIATVDGLLSRTGATGTDQLRQDRPAWLVPLLERSFGNSVVSVE